MGTASQSFTNKSDQDDFDALVNEAIGGNRQRRLKYDMKCREVVNKVLNTSPALNAIRTTMRTVINNEVRTEIREKLKAWVAGGKKPDDYPF